MGFADELKSAKESNEFAKTELPTQKKEAAAAPDLISDLHSSDPAPKAAAAPVEEAPAPKAAEPAPAQPATKKYRIGAQEFDNAEDAFAYANELELSLVQQEAYKQGVEAAKPKEDKITKTIEDEIEQELFETPKEALTKYKKHILETVKADIKAEQAREATIKQTWKEFYEKNADLAAVQDVVQYTLQKNWNEIGHLESNKALSILAEKTRSLLASYKEATLPTKELPSGVAKATSATPGAPAPVAEKKVETVVDFITQVKQASKRGAQKVQQT